MLLRILVACLLLFAANAYAQEATSTQPAEKTEEQLAEEKPKEQKTVTRSTAMAASGDSAAGSIGGIKSPESIKVSSGGAATQSIPIVVPPGTAGVQPNLSFNYNSQGENSLLGVGWSVSGLPIIHRCPKTVAQDNGVRWGINYNSDDRFCLDGQRLMVINNGTYGADNSEYRTEVDSFLKITAKTAGGTSGPAYFIVKTKGGETMEFGGNASSAEGRIEAHGKTAVRVWALSKVSDVKGNYLTISYDEDGIGEYRPKEINYTYNTAAGMTTATRKVVFGYDGVDRADKIPLWVGGSKILTTKLLTSVKTYAPPPGSSTPVLVRDYRLEYETGTATNRSRVKRIKECDAAGNCLPSSTQAAWQFTWQEGGNGTYQVFPHPVQNNTFRNIAAWTGDFNGDGRTDLLSEDSNKLWTHLSNGNGTYAPPVQFTYASASYSITHTWIGDFNADGLDDFVSTKNGKLHLYISQGNGTYILQSSLTYNSNKMDTNHIWIGDTDGDGKADVISYKAPRIYTYRSTGTGFVDPPLEYNVGNTGWFKPSTTRLGDFNGDGMIDIFTRDSGWGNTYINLGNGQFQLFRADTSSNLNDAPILMGDYNGDGKTDIAHSCPK